MRRSEHAHVSVERACEGTRRRIWCWITERAPAVRSRPCPAYQERSNAGSTFCPGVSMLKVPNKCFVYMYATAVYILADLVPFFHNQSFPHVHRRLPGPLGRANGFLSSATVGTAFVGPWSPTAPTRSRDKFRRAPRDRKSRLYEMPW